MTVLYQIELEIDTPLRLFDGSEHGPEELGTIDQQTKTVVAAPGKYGSGQHQKKLPAALRGQDRSDKQRNGMKSFFHGADRRLQRHAVKLEQYNNGSSLSSPLGKARRRTAAMTPLRRVNAAWPSRKLQTPPVIGLLGEQEFHNIPSVAAHRLHLRKRSRTPSSPSADAGPG